MRLSIKASIDGALEGVADVAIAGAVEGLRQPKAAKEPVFDLGLVRCSGSSTLPSIMSVGVNVVIDVVDTNVRSGYPEVERGVI